jgi:hypothetical protein
MIYDQDHFRSGGPTVILQKIFYPVNSLTKQVSMKIIFSLLILLFSILSYAQKKQSVSLALTDNASSYPFGTFIGFASEPVHAGFEAGWSHNSQKKKHDWYWQLKVGYFYHQFVQHGIPIYADFGYRYRFIKHLSADISLGAGYFHSIPATEVYRLDGAGNYENAKGIGRPQVMVPLTMGVNYDFKLKDDRPSKIFFQYQQRLQAPFVNNYVPILPYNQIALGFAYYLKGKK